MMLHPAYLWIGSHHALDQQVDLFLKQVLCVQHGCNNCSNCKALNERRHFSVLRMVSENQYTVADVETVLHTISFALDPDQHFFIIFERAELFHHASAQRLLKSIEEPPAGYHFILLARRKHGILPTISSRCLVEHFESTVDADLPLFKYFIGCSPDKAAEFAQQLSREKVNDSQIYEYIDLLSQYWHEKLLRAAEKGDSVVGITQSALEILQSARSRLPMSGSGNLFLKNLYMQLSLLS